MNGTAVIQLTANNDTSTARDVGLHINTTLSFEWFKKAKVLFILNFLLSVFCIITTCIIVMCYWKEMANMRSHVDMLQEQVKMSQSVRQAAPQDSPVTPQGLRWERREAPHRREMGRSMEPSETGRRYYVDDLEEDLHFTNSKNRDNNREMDTLGFVRQGPVIAHYVGGGLERNLGDETYVGPWTADLESSSQNFSQKLELMDHKLVKVHEGGVYLVYAQLVYVSSSPMYFTLWAKNGLSRARLLTTCASGDVATKRSLRNSQISCSVQTVARLTNGDVINFAQREKNAIVDLNPGASYFGFVKLSS